MKICPKCQRHQKELQKVVFDSKTKKKWLVSYCGSCKFNFELEETPPGTTPREELDKPGTPIWLNGKFQ